MSGLPEGWETTTLADVADFNPKHDASAERDMVVSFVPMPAVDEHLGAITAPQERKLDEVWKGFTHFADGDVIFAKITPCMENGKSAIACDLTNGMACGSTEFHVLRPQSGILPEIIWHFLRQRSFRAEAEKHMTGAVGQRRVPKAYLEGHTLPLPPLAEQRRIVAKLDRLSARTGKAKTHLAQVQTLATRAKQATLTAAFRGELTADWRSEHPESHPWQTVELSEVADGFNYGSATKSSKEGSVPVLRMGNIQDGFLDWANLVFTSDLTEIDKFKLSPGDVLFNRTNSPALVGKTALYKGERPAIFAGYLIRIRCSDRLLPEFLNYSLNSPEGRAYSWRVKSDGVSQSNINAKKLRAFSFDLPSLPEQTEIVRRIETAFAKIDRMVEEASRAADLLDRLDQQLLAKAFRGELVHQDPDDEPASALLARIREARANVPKPKRRRKSAKA